MKCTKRSWSVERDIATSLGQARERPRRIRFLVQERESPADGRDRASPRAIRSHRQAANRRSGAAPRRTASRSFARAQPRRRDACWLDSHDRRPQERRDPGIGAERGTRNVQHARQRGQERIERTRVEPQEPAHDRRTVRAPTPSRRAVEHLCAAHADRVRQLWPVGARSRRSVSTLRCAHPRGARQHVRDPPAERARRRPLLEADRPARRRSPPSTIPRGRRGTRSGAPTPGMIPGMISRARPAPRPPTA